MNKDNKNSKTINGTLIKESLMDYNNLAQQLKENVTESVKSLLDEQVKQAYASILNESDDDEIEEKEYDVEEVDDTNDDTTDEETVEDSEATEGEENTEDAEEGGTEPEGDQEDTEDKTDVEETEDGDFEDDLDFEKYKVSDNEYDFRNAKDDEIVKIYKRLNNDDQVTVVKDDDKVNISDKETGAEYIIDLSGDEDTSEIIDDNFTDDMKESRIYEIALNEYDSNMGYTDDYQDKDVMTSDGVTEPGKGRDIDDGVPHTANKPWSNKKDGAPFNKKAQTNECGTFIGDEENFEEPVEETVAQKGGTNRGRAKSHVPNTSCKNNPPKHNTTFAGEYQGNPDAANESIIKKANKIFKENKQLKEQLNKITEMLKEAAVTNVNLGGIIKLISENSTTKEEKRDIINRFTNEVHTIEESKSLYKTISNELKKNPQATKNINEEKEFGTSNAEVINESKFYQDESLMSSLGLMHKICK